MSARINLVRRGLFRDCVESEVEAFRRKGWQLVPEKSGTGGPPAAAPVSKRKPRKKNK